MGDEGHCIGAAFQIREQMSQVASTGVLAAENAPFFLSLQEAERSLLYDREATNILFANDQLPGQGISLYLEQSGAWLENIHFSSSVLKITLDGTDLSGVRLKVTGTGVQDYDDYPAEKTISLSAPDGPPDIIKIALLKGNTWLDYFYDNRRSRNNPFVPGIRTWCSIIKSRAKKLSV